MNEWTDAAWQRRYEIIYKCQLSALYHRKRERFYSLLDKSSSSFALIAGSAAMSDFLHTAEAKAVAGGIVALVTIPGVVFSWAERAKHHAVLASRFLALEATVEGIGVTDIDELDKLMERAISVETEEPPQLSTLTRICQNEIAAASGQQNYVSKVSLWQRWTANWI